jgi:hypothetical protein
MIKPALSFEIKQLKLRGANLLFMRAEFYATRGLLRAKMYITAVLGKLNPLK